MVSAVSHLLLQRVAIVSRWLATQKRAHMDISGVVTMWSFMVFVRVCSPSCYVVTVWFFMGFARICAARC